MPATLLESLLGEIVRLKGEALLLRAGERPCVLARSDANPDRDPIDWDHVDISARPLTADTLVGMLGQLLSFDERRSLYETGRIVREVAFPPSARPFVLEASRAGGEVRLEIRPADVTLGFAEPAPGPAAAPVEARVELAADAPDVAMVDPPPDADSDGTCPALPDEPAPTSDDPEPDPLTEVELGMLLEAGAEAAGVDEELPDTEPAGAVVIPHVRPPRPEPAPPPVARSSGAVVEAIGTAYARRATRLHASPGQPPLGCIDGRMMAFAADPPLSAADIQRFTLEFRPAGPAAGAEWSCTIPELGTVTCVASNEDPGIVVHLPSPVQSADDLELEPAIRTLAGEADGLIVIAGPRSSGKSTLVHAFVDLVNRERSDYLVTIESGIRVRHKRGHAIVSQRERSGGEAIAAAIRAALREGPDVLAVDDLRSPEALEAALDGARAGRLIVGSIAAQSVTDAVARLVDGFVADRRPHVQALLASSLRAVIAQVLVERIGGGRVAARELLLNGPVVAPLVADGSTWHLNIAIEAGRARGMKPMADSLASLVRRGLVDVAAAWRVAPDREALRAALARGGIDVSAGERGA